MYSRVNNEAEVKNRMIAELGKFALKNGLEKFEIPKKIHLDAGKNFITIVGTCFFNQHFTKMVVIQNQLHICFLPSGFEWSPDSGLVTAAFKIRRRNVYEKYADEIAAMYA